MRWCGGVPLGAPGNGFQVVLALKMTPLLFFLSLSDSLSDSSVILPPLSAGFSVPFLSPSVTCLSLLELKAKSYFILSVTITHYSLHTALQRFQPMNTGLNSLLSTTNIKLCLSWTAYMVLVV